MLIAGVLPACMFSRQDFDMLTTFIISCRWLKKHWTNSPFGKVEGGSKSDFQPCFGKRNKLRTVFIMPSAYEVKKRKKKSLGYFIQFCWQTSCSSSRVVNNVKLQGLGWGGVYVWVIVLPLCLVLFLICNLFLLPPPPSRAPTASLQFFKGT